MGSGTGQLSASRQMENWVEIVENVRLVNGLAFVKNVFLKVTNAEFHTDTWFLLLEQKNTSASVQKFYLREVNVTLLNRLNGSGKKQYLP